MSERMIPTEPGWYWMRRMPSADRVVELDRLGNKIVICTDNCEFLEIPKNADFRGPIPNYFEEEAK